MKNLLFIVIFLFAIVLPACQQSDNDSDNFEIKNSFKYNDKMPEELIAGINAHGGLNRWSEMRTLEFAIPKKESLEHHLTDLYTRKALISHNEYTLGWNGKEAWVTPSIEAFGKTPPRFYYNLVFYFHAMPFLLADPGIKYEILPQKEFEGKMYNGVKITYQTGVGDSPEDIYIAYFDASTNRMRYLLYTVTYFSGEKNEKYHALDYAEWKEVNGLLLPEKMIGRTYENDTLGAVKYERLFSDIKLSKEAVEDKKFEIPEGAEIDSLIVH